MRCTKLWTAVVVIFVVGRLLRFLLSISRRFRGVRCTNSAGAFVVNAVVDNVRVFVFVLLLKRWRRAQNVAAFHQDDVELKILRSMVVRFLSSVRIARMRQL